MQLLILEWQADQALLYTFGIHPDNRYLVFHAGFNLERIVDPTSDKLIRLSKKVYSMMRSLNFHRDSQRFQVEVQLQKITVRIA